MAFPFLETTAPAAAQTTDARGQVPMLALVIVQCEKEPWRVGQYALFPLGKKRWLGRRGEGNLTQAARILWIQRNKLYRIMKALGIKSEEE